jgi:WD40 repeat protein
MADNKPRPNPYVGPRSFKTGETLYGRDRELNELLNLLIAERIVLLHSPSGAGKSSLVYAGLIPRLWEEGFQVLPVARVNLEPPNQYLKAKNFNRYVFSAVSSFDEALAEDQRLPLDELAEISLGDYLERFKAPHPAMAQLYEDMPPMETEVLIFDQFEEILTSAPTDLEGKAAFFTQLGNALRDRKRWALFAMREDYIAALDPYLRPVPTRLNNTFRLDLLGVQAALQAIQLPPLTMDVKFNDDAANKLADDLRQVQVQRPDGTMEVQLGPYVEPVQLQVVCYRLWQNLKPDDRMITLEDIAQVGDVNQSLGDYYAERVAGVAKETNESERNIRVWFDEKLITESGIRSQVLMEPERSSDLDNDAIRLLEDAHLVRAEKRRGATWFELAHDRLLEPVKSSNLAWFQAHLSLLQRQAALWHKDNRPEHLLLREHALSEAEKWAAEHPKELSPFDGDFLEACKQLRNREEEALAAAERERRLKLEAAEKVAEAERLRAEEQASAAKKLRLRLILATVAFVAALFFAAAAAFTGNQARLASYQNATLAVVAQNASTLAVGNAATAESNAVTAQAASIIANLQRATAQAAESTASAAGQIAEEQKATAVYNAGVALQQANLARSRELSSLSLDYLSDQSDLSLLLSIEAFRKSETSQAMDALLKALQRNLSREIQSSDQKIPTQPISILALAASPDGRRLAWAGNQGFIRMWDFEVQGVAWERRVNDTVTINALAFSPDGKILASADSAAEIDFWEVATGAPVRIIHPQIDSILTMAFSPDGGNLAYGGTTKGNEVNLFIRDLDTGNFKGLSIKPLKNDVLSLAWSPDGKLLASAGRERVIRIWDVETTRELVKFESFDGPVKSLAFSPNGQTLVTGANDETLPFDKNILMWDMSVCINPPESAAQAAGISSWEAPACKLQKPVAFTGQDADVTSVAFSSDGSILATGDSAGVTRLWDVRYRELLDQKPPVASGFVSALTFTQVKDNLLLAVGSLDRTISLSNLHAGDSFVSYSATLGGRVNSISFPSKNSLQALGGDGKQTFFWTGNGSGEVSQSSTFPLLSSLIALSADGRTFAALVGNNQEDSIEVWSVGEAKSLLSIPAPVGNIITAQETTPGQTITQTESTSSGTVRSLTLSSDGSILAAGICLQREEQLDICSKNEIFLWRSGSGEKIAQFPSEHNGAILSLAFSLDGHILASGGNDAAIYLQDAQSGGLLGLPLVGQGSPVTALTFSPTGDRLASGGSNSLLALWNVDLAQLIGNPIAGTSGTITSLAFDPDGKTMVSGSDNGSLAWWSLDAWLDLACKYTKRNLSLAEWAQFFKDESYRQTCSQWPVGQ